MSYISIVLTVSAALVALVAYIWYVRVAFAEGPWWGLGVMFLPPLIFVFLVYKWPLGRGPLIAGSVGGFMLLVLYPNAKDQLEEVKSLARASVITMPSSTPAVITQEYLDKKQAQLKQTEAHLLGEKKVVNGHDTNAIRRLTLQIQDYNRSLEHFRRMSADFARMNQAAVASASASKGTPDANGWTLNTSSVTFPSTPVSGRFKGSSFAVNRTIVQGGNLVLQSGNAGMPDREILIALNFGEPRSLPGRIYSISPDLHHGTPEVHLRDRKGSNEFHDSDLFDKGYAMRLEFGSLENNEISGRVYLCLPDAERSLVRGTFRANIQP